MARVDTDSRSRATAKSSSMASNSRAMARSTSTDKASNTDSISNTSNTSREGTARSSTGSSRDSMVKANKVALTPITQMPGTYYNPGLYRPS